MKTIDLFAGCGGLSLGLQNAGFEIIEAYDHWKPAVATYNLNFTSHKAQCADLADVNVQNEIIAAQAELIVGGPPCQDFSSAGKRDENLGRGDLSVTFADIIVKANPRFFIMENVERITKTQKIIEVKKKLTESGYKLFHIVLDASFCGVPQSRKRFFMFGSKSLNPALLENVILNRLASKPMSLRDFFGDSLGIDYYYRHPRSYARRAVFSIDEPSPTIRGVNRPIPSGYPGHPGDSAHISKVTRGLSFEERAMVQTFPPEFKFYGTKSDKEQQIGNAVPVKLAEFIGQCLLEYTHLSSNTYSFAEGSEVFAFEKEKIEYIQLNASQ